MKKLLSLTLLLLSLVITGCSFGSPKEDVVQVPESNPIEEPAVEPVVETEPVAQEEPEAVVEELPEEEPEIQKEFDPNAYNDEEINELISMLEGLVEVETY